jgi:hypothetical protein
LMAEALGNTSADAALSASHKSDEDDVGVHVGVSISTAWGKDEG